MSDKQDTQYGLSRRNMLFSALTIAASALVLGRRYIAGSARAAENANSNEHFEV